MNQRKCALFKLRNQWYGIPVQYVVSAIIPEVSVSIQDLPDYVEGVIKFGNSVIPVVDLEKRMTGFCSNSNKQETVLVLSINGILIGFGIEELKLELYTYEDSQIQSTKQGVSASISPFLESVIVDYGYYILNMDTVINQGMAISLQEIILKELGEWNQKLLVCQKDLGKLRWLRKGIWGMFALSLFMLLVWGYLATPPFVYYIGVCGIVGCVSIYIIQNLLSCINEVANEKHKSCLSQLQIRKLFEIEGGG